MFTHDYGNFCQSILRCFGITDYVTHTEEETGVEKVRDGHGKSCKLGKTRDVYIYCVTTTITFKLKQLKRSLVENLE